MARKSAQGHGFLLCLLLNLLFRFEWCALAIIYGIVRFFWPLPLFPVWILLGIWLVYALLVTALLSFGNASGNASVKQNANKNPYSKSTADYLTPKD